MHRLFPQVSLLAAIAIVLQSLLIAKLPAQDALERLERLVDEVPLGAPSAEAELPRPAPAQPGYLGVTVNESTLARGGAVVESVRSATPAAAAGLQARDEIVNINGREIRGIADFSAAMRELSAGEDAVIQVLRSGRRFEFTAKLSAKYSPRDTAGTAIDVRRPISRWPANRRPIVGRSADPALHRAIEYAYLGLKIGPLRTRRYHLLGLQTDWGVVVEDVLPGSPAERHGVPRGAIIVGLNGFHVEHVDTMMAMMSRLPPDRPVELTYLLGGRTYRQVVPLDATPASVSSGTSGRRALPLDHLPAPLDLPDTKAADLPPAESATVPVDPATVLRLPSRVETTKPPIEDKVRTAKRRELEELRRRAAELEAELSELRKVADEIAPDDSAANGSAGEENADEVE